MDIYIVIDEDFHNTGNMVYCGDSLEEAFGWISFYEEVLHTKTFFGMLNPDYHGELND